MEVEIPPPWECAIPSKQATLCGAPAPSAEHEAFGCSHVFYDFQVFPQKQSPQNEAASEREIKPRFPCLHLSQEGSCCSSGQSRLPRAGCPERHLEDRFSVRLCPGRPEWSLDPLLAPWASNLGASGEEMSSSTPGVRLEDNPGPTVETKP